ncbi:class A beta-lactamase-related serine hydrolase [Microbacterium protaetiae]|uniref:Class A beta-lactamase-related serine hydrolase n=1 Tax=Microbacterium protaetiae TaxID=2509458 RepID=A0A4P6EDT0_9MICO|nr:serine hydrolase domain-containing protein [Microbacterium protaetiae]QAY59483.1 class A beta-lactamase-related serine hydrolase [Microbacterium protaetiae]
MPIRTGVRRVAAVAAVVVALTLGAAGCSGDPAVAGLATLAPDQKLPTDTQKQLESAVTDAMAATGASGAIVGVWVPWSGSWVAGVGTVAPGSKTPVDDDMTFRAGPVTRAMTCDALYELAADGTVQLDDSVTDYVGGIPKYTDITLEQLCDSTSGIGSYNRILGAQSLTNPAREWDPRELVGYGVGQVSGDIEPGNTFRDSDAGYLLLGLALERASGKSAQQLFDKRIFDPLGLEHTALPGDQSAAPVVDSSTPLRGFYFASKTKSGAYQCDKATEITEQSASYGFTDSGVVTDIRDLATYTRALASQALVKSKTRFTEGLPLSSGSPSWFTTSGGVVEAGPLIGQYGSTRGYLTSAFSDPTSGLTVAVVLNNSAAGRGVVVDLARELAAIAAQTPAADGEQAVAVGLPWTAEQYHTTIADAAICTTAKK